EVVPLIGVTAVIVQFFGMIKITDITPVFSPHRIITAPPGDNGWLFPLPERIVQPGHKTGPVGVFRYGSSRKPGDSAVQIGKGNRLFANPVLPALFPWVINDQRRPGRLFPETKFPEALLLPKVITVIRPQHHY